MIEIRKQTSLAYLASKKGAICWRRTYTDVLSFQSAQALALLFSHLECYQWTRWRKFRSFVPLWENFEVLPLVGGLLQVINICFTDT
jgi:hypothetical protein